MEIKVGDYVRYHYIDWVQINKIDYILGKQENEEQTYFTDDKNGAEIIGENDIIKSSENIKKLIEIGDFVEYETTFDDIIHRDFIKIDEKILDGIKNSPKNCKVKSIMTKEMYSEMKYKVEDTDGK